MLVAINENHECVLTKQAIKNQNYFCPHCKSKVILKIGTKVIAHFAHVNPCKIWRSKGESALHYQTKYKIASMLKRLNFKVEVEPYYENIQQFPDIVVNSSFAIEVQFSNIPLSEIQKRTAGLMSVGLRPFWIIEDIKYRNGKLTLNDHQASFINATHRSLYTWQEKFCQLIRYSNIQHLGGRQFLAKRDIVEDMTILLTEKRHKNMVCYKLGESLINRYIQHCRRKNSVLEPTLSAMYQLQLNDKQVIQQFGIIIPLQIYIKPHPIEWQLQLRLLEIHDELTIANIGAVIKLRDFAYHHYSKSKLLNKIIEQYQNARKLNCNDVQIIY